MMSFFKKEKTSDDKLLFDGNKINGKDEDEISKKMDLECMFSHDFHELFTCAIANCDFLKTYYTDRYNANNNDKFLIHAYFADVAYNSLYETIVDIKQPKNMNEAAQEKFQKIYRGNELFVFKTIYFAMLRDIYLPYLKQRMNEIMKNYAIIFYKLQGIINNKDQKAELTKINNDIKEYLGIDMSKMVESQSLNGKCKVDYNQIFWHIIKNNHALDYVEQLNQSLEKVVASKLSKNCYSPVQTYCSDSLIAKHNDKRHLRQNWPDQFEQYDEGKSIASCFFRYKNLNKSKKPADLKNARNYKNNISNNK